MSGDYSRLLQTFGGVLREKICSHTIFKENIESYISLESLLNVDLEKKDKRSKEVVVSCVVTLTHLYSELFSWLFANGSLFSHVSGLKQIKTG